MRKYAALLISALLVCLTAGTSAAADAPPRPELAQAAQQAAPDTTMGIMVFDMDSGRQLVNLNRDQQFKTESVVKLMIALDDLDRHGTADSGEIQEMLSRSDDNVADQLWVADGETSIVTDIAARALMTNTVPPADPGWWGNTLTTPTDLSALYQYILLGIPQADRDVILPALAGITPTAADGTDQTFGFPDAAQADGETYAVKQGWAVDDAGVDHLNSTGLLGDRHQYIVALLTSQNSKGMAADSAEVTAAAKVLMQAIPGN
ncbi:hypothetical protein D5S17_21805 [Pseudonocardiaceae bacterium YIM PH 21723]|nr:hypothetical protein D5S17_21805 [Pseudonocardiaceae bacterium YIM PH 21723]